MIPSPPDSLRRLSPENPPKMDGRESVNGTPRTSSRIARSSTAASRKSKSVAEMSGSEFRTQLATLLSAWKLILVTLILGLAAGASFYFVKAPTYQTEGSVQVEEKQKGIAGLEELSDLMTVQSPAETEIEVLRSRFLLGTVVDELHLEILAEPRFFPVFGRAVARRYKGETPASPALGRARYAWGGERIIVKSLEVPTDWVGEWLTLVALEGERYQVFGPDHEEAASGMIGTEPSTPNPDPNLGVKVVIAELRARAGTEFRISLIDREDAIDHLQERLTVAEKGKKTGVLAITLAGDDPRKVNAILTTAQNAYLRQNVERKSEEAERTLQFIEAQLPELKTKLETAEAALNVYRTKTGSIDVSMEAKASLDLAADVERDLTMLKLQLEESRERFTEDHPAIVAMRSKVKKLENQRASLDSRFKTLPGSELESGRLLRDVKVAQELYVLLLNKSQELKLVKSGTVGTVRILDRPTLPRHPVSPKFSISLVVASIVGIFLGIGLAFVKKALDVGVDDPEKLEAELDVPVYASIPHSEVQKGMFRKRGGSVKARVLASSSPGDLAVEAMRSMRTSLQFALAEANNNIVAISGPSPGIGKSFVAVNLAHVLADFGKRVLLIDADLRRGHLHDYFGQDRGKGLAAAITTGDSPETCLTDVSENLHFMPTGELPPNPSELLGSARFEEVMNWALKYDVVVIDTAPVLAVTDGVLAARLAGTNLLVLKSGQHPVREINAAVKRMNQNGIVIKAFVLNDVPPSAGYAYGRQGKYGYHYQYDYK